MTSAPLRDECHHIQNENSTTRNVNATFSSTNIQNWYLPWQTLWDGASSGVFSNWSCFFRPAYIHTALRPHRERYTESFFPFDYNRSVSTDLLSFFFQTDSRRPLVKLRNSSLGSDRVSSVTLVGSWRFRGAFVWTSTERENDEKDAWRRGEFRLGIAELIYGNDWLLIRKTTNTLRWLLWSMVLYMFFFLINRALGCPHEQNQLVHLVVIRQGIMTRTLAVIIIIKCFSIYIAVTI